MKKITLSIMFLGIGLLAANAQSKVPTVISQESPAKGPVLSVEKTVCELGEIKEGVQALATFTITNTGDAPLVISEVAKSCGCTKPEFPTEPIAPGETAIISAKYNSSGRPGHFSKTLTVKHNGEGGNVYLILKGTVIKATN